MRRNILAESRMPFLKYYSILFYITSYMLLFVVQMLKIHFVQYMNMLLPFCLYQHSGWKLSLLVIGIVSAFVVLVLIAAAYCICALCRKKVR